MPQNAFKNLLSSRQQESGPLPGKMNQGNRSAGKHQWQRRNWSGRVCGLVPSVFTELFLQAQWEGGSLFPQMPPFCLSTSRSKMFLPEETIVWFLPPSSHPAQVFLTAGKAQNGPWEVKTQSVP